jgi:hypothetical protein
MGYYKITSLTHELGKRHNKVNATVYIDVVSNFADSRIAIAPGADIFIESNHLPMSAQKLRSEGLITIIPLDKNSYIKTRSAAESGKNVSTQQEVVEVVDNKILTDDKSKRNQQKSFKKEKDETAD